MIAGRPSKSSLRFPVMTVLLACMLAAPVQLLADTVILRTGRKLEGKIVRIAAGSYMVIRVRGRLMRIPLKKIRSLRKSPKTPRKAAPRRTPKARTRVQPGKPGGKPGAPGANSGMNNKILDFTLGITPGYSQYREGRTAYAYTLGGLFAIGLASTLYHSLILASVRRDASRSVAYDALLDRRIDNRFRRVRERLDWSRFLLLAAWMIHGFDRYSRSDSRSGPAEIKFTVYSLERHDLGVAFGFRFALNP